jgi:tRNA1(Val) A37 N6-methylase TrmN6
MIADVPLETSVDAVLGGRLRLCQPLTGHRVGHDAILLAAATAARAGEHAVELGAGVGAAGLALAARVAGVRVTLVEIDAALAALAAENARLNALDDRVRAVAGDAEDQAALAAAGLAAGSIDRVLMNPPFRDATRANLSPDPARRLAYAGDPDLLPRWIASAATLLKRGGVLTLIWRADAADDVLAALKPAFGAIATLCVKPRPDRPAIRILLRAVKGGHGAIVHHDALELNDTKNRPAPAAELVLRDGQTLSLASM